MMLRHHSTKSLFWYQFTEFRFLPSCIGGQIPIGSDPGQLHPSKLDSAMIRQRSLATVYCLVAAEEAIADAAWSPKDDETRAYTGTQSNPLIE